MAKSTRPKFGEARGWYEKDPNTGMGGKKANPKRPKSVKPYIAPVPSSVQATTGRTTPTKGELQRAAQSPVRARRKLARRLLNRPEAKTPKPKPYRPPSPSKAVNKAIEFVDGALDAGKDAVDSAAAAAAKLPDKKVTKAFGKPTLGTPRVKEVVRAKKEGRLSGVRRGKVVATPQARRAKKQLKRAKKAYARKAKPDIEGLLTPAQERFAEAFSKASGLPPKLAGDWTLKESGGASAGAGGEAGQHNQLGIGYPAKPTAMSQSGYFNNTTPEQAGKNSARWIRGEIGGEYSYKAAPSIQKIDDLVKSGASEAEIRAYIAGPSAWGTGEIPNSPQVTASPGKAGPKVTARLKNAEAQAKKLGIKPPKQAPATKTLPARKLKGSWGGSYAVLKNAVKGFPISSEKRDEHHSLSLSNPGSDHNEANKLAYAYDIPTTAGEGWAHTIAKRLGIKGYHTGDYTAWSSPKYPGYAIQVLWAVDGHYDHVHVGAHWTGEDLKPGTYAGGPSGSTVTASGSTVSSYAAATGQPVGKVEKQFRQGKLTPQEIYEKLESVGVGESSTTTSQPSTAVLDELAKKYGVAA